MAPHSSTLDWQIPWTCSLVAYSPLGRKELDTTERLHFHFLCHQRHVGGPPPAHKFLKGKKDLSFIFVLPECLGQLQVCGRQSVKVC